MKIFTEQEIDLLPGSTVLLHCGATVRIDRDTKMLKTSNGFQLITVAMQVEHAGQEVVAFCKMMEPFDSTIVEVIEWAKPEEPEEPLYDFGPFVPPKPLTPPKTTTEDRIRQVCAQLADFLCAKNRAYGDSALNPCRIFAKDVAADAQLRVRIDDKINRLMKGSSYPGDNDTLDLAGYLVLALVQAGWEGETDAAKQDQH